jgi:ABC-type uncharacterized transport system substrate-binding protein
VKRRTIGVLVTLALALMAPLGAEAQSPAKVPRIGFPLCYRPDAPHTQSFVEVFRKGLREHGWVEGQNLAMTRERADALITWAEALTLAHHRWGAEFATQHRLAMISEIKEFADASGLVTYGLYPPDMFHRAATYADKILSGAKPADLPVGQPTRFELITNLKTAKALGLTIPRLSSSRPTK